MHHPFTWYLLLPEELQHLLGEHTFFALVVALLVLLFAVKARAALAAAKDPAIPVAELGARNIAELLVQLVVSQSDSIIGKEGRKYVPYFGSFFIFILVGNLIGLLPGFGSPTRRRRPTLSQPAT